MYACVGACVYTHTHTHAYIHNLKNWTLCPFKQKLQLKGTCCNKKNLKIFAFPLKRSAINPVKTI